MIPALPNRRKTTGLERVTLAALLLQFVALLWAVWHGARELRSLETRDAAVEKLVEHVDFDVNALAHESPAPKGKP